MILGGSGRWWFAASMKKTGGICVKTEVKNTTKKKNITKTLCNNIKKYFVIILQKHNIEGLPWCSIG